MALLIENTSSRREYKVKDMSQADFGRLEIDLAEVKMPGLMSCRAKLGPSQPFKGVHITCSLDMTIQTAVLIETLTALGAEVRWCSSNIFSIQDYAAAAIARDSAAVFAWKGETLQEYWWCIERSLDWGPGGGPDLIVDDGGDTSLLIHEGVKAEEEYEKSGKIPDPNTTNKPEFQIVLGLIRDGLKVDPMKYRKMKERLAGVSEETTTGVKWLFQMLSSVTKSKVQSINERNIVDLETVIQAEDELKKAMKFSCWVIGLSFGGIFDIDAEILQNPTLVVTSKLPLKASIILMVLNMFFGVASITLATCYPPTGRLITITTVIKHITLVSMALATILASIPLLA